MKAKAFREFLASLPPAGDEKERLRQERILSTTRELVKAIEIEERDELKTLRAKIDRNPTEELLLDYLERKYED
jgi:hypothetical protein